MKIVTKTSLKKLLRDELALSDSAAQASIELIFDEIMRATAIGDVVKITGFGKFSRILRQPSTARNPRTGERVSLPARYTPRFAAGKTFRDRVDALSR